MELNNTNNYGCYVLFSYRLCAYSIDQKVSSTEAEFLIGLTVVIVKWNTMIPLKKPVGQMDKQMNDWTVPTYIMKTVLM